MPIGSKSYYDTLDMAENSEPRPLLFRRGEGKSRAGQSSSTPKPSQQSAKPATADPANSMHQIEAVACQILELAARTGAILERAEEMAKRAEDLFAAACESAQRAEAAALRAEAVAAQFELELNNAEDPSGGDDSGNTGGELELVAQITERLRNGLQQIEGITTRYEADAMPAATVVEPEPAVEEVQMAEVSGEPALSLIDDTKPVELLEKTLELSRDSLGYSRSFARTPNAPIDSDALAHSLVTLCNDTGMPRVSPYIIQVPSVIDCEAVFPQSQMMTGHDGHVNVAV